MNNLTGQKNLERSTCELWLKDDKRLLAMLAKDGKIHA